MNILKIGAAVLLVTLIVLALMAPLGPVPGFLIGGSDADVPSSWGDTLPVHEIQLQIGEGPIGRTVIIWMVQFNGDLYVIGEAGRGWTSGIGSGGPVRMQMEGKRYELTATPVAAGRQEVITAWLKKYETDYPEIVAGFSSEDRAGNAVVFRLSARS